MIPKTKAMQTPDSLPPIALQTTRQKWLTSILLIQLEDVLLHCIPSQQTGLLRHRSILQHVYGSRALWDALREGAALSVDFKNAFPTMSHEMVSAALGLMCIPFLYIRLILHLPLATTRDVPRRHWSPPVLLLGRGLFEGAGCAENSGLVQKLCFECETENVPTFW